jgi:hypothetical protein
LRRVKREEVNVMSGLTEKEPDERYVDDEQSVQIYRNEDGKIEDITIGRCGGTGGYGGHIHVDAGDEDDDDD